MPIELVLFDVDGTLVDHETAARTAFTGWLGTADADRLAPLWERIADRHFAAYQAGTVSFAEQRRRRLREFLPYVDVDPAGWPDGRLDALFATYLTGYRDAWQPYPDAVACLDGLRSTEGPPVRLAVLSNGDQEQQEDKLRRTGLDRYFDAVLTSGRLGVAKPDPAAFTLACAALGVAPARTAYVGDRLDLDARAATNAGLRGVWLNRSGEPAPDGVATVRSLAEIGVRLAVPTECCRPGR